MSIVEESIVHNSGLVSPKFLARDRYVELGGFWTQIFPLGRVQFGSVILFEGSSNSGVTSAVFRLLSAGGMKKRWIAFVGFESLGFLAASENGVDLAKVVSVPDPGADLARVVAVLTEAFQVVVIANPRFISHTQASNLISRTRINNSIIVVVHQDFYRAANQDSFTGAARCGDQANRLVPGRYVRSGTVGDGTGVGRRQAIKGGGHEDKAGLEAAPDSSFSMVEMGQLLQGKRYWPGSYDYLIRSSISGFSGLDRGSGFIRECSLSLLMGSRRDGGRAKSVTVLI